MNNGNTRIKQKKNPNEPMGNSKNPLIITLKANVFNSPIKRHRLLIQLKSRIEQFVAWKKHTSQWKTHTETKSERMEKDMPTKWKPKPSRSN
jgi:hypothetical protein